VTIAGATKSFMIHDRSPIDVELDTDTMLDPGKIATVGVEVEIDQAIATLDFSTLDTDGGVLDLDTFDPQMPAFRSAMIDSFVIAQGEADLQ
jgi:hypothetical protein